MAEMEDISAVCQAEISFVPQVEELWKYPPVSDPDEIFRERLKELVDRSGRSPRAVSLAIGANHSYVSQLINGKGGSPAASRLADLAREFGTTTEYLLGTADTPEPVASEVALLPDHRPHWGGGEHVGTPIPLVGTGDCATLAVELADSHETIEIERSSFDPDYHVRYIARPASLTGARDVYAIEFRGDSMMPRFEPGEIGLVDPGRTPRPRDYVVVQLRNGRSDEVGSVMVKRLVRATNHAIELEQFNPPAVFSIPRASVLRVHRIVDMLFG